MSVFSRSLRRARDHFAERARRAMANPKKEGMSMGRRRAKICDTMSEQESEDQRGIPHNVAREAKLEARRQGKAVVESLHPGFGEQLRFRS